MFDGVTLPFTVAELLQGTMEFIKVLGPFILLGLILVFTPRIIRVIRTSAGGGGGGRNG